MVPRLWHLWAAAFTAIAASYPAAYLTGFLPTAALYLGVFIVLEYLLYLWGRARVMVTADGLAVGDGSPLALAAVTGVDVLPDVRLALVPGTPARTRGWIRSGVQVRSAAGPVWVLSSRRP
ncbi:MAG: DUF3093 family protein, partial [Frankia sp.]